MLSQADKISASLAELCVDASMNRSVMNVGISEPYQAFQPKVESAAFTCSKPMLFSSLILPQGLLSQLILVAIRLKDSTGDPDEIPVGTVHHVVVPGPAIANQRLADIETVEVKDRLSFFCRENPGWVQYQNLMWY